MRLAQRRYAMWAVLLASAMAGMSCGSGEGGTPVGTSTTRSVLRATAADSEFGFAVPPVLLFRRGHDGLYQYRVYIRPTRALPRNRRGPRAQILLDGGGETVQPTTLTRNPACYASDGSVDVESLINPKDGQVVEVRVEIPHHMVIARANVRARKATVSQIANDRKQKKRLQRMGCGRLR